MKNERYACNFSLSTKLILLSKISRILSLKMQMTFASVASRGPAVSISRTFLIEHRVLHVQISLIHSEKIREYLLAILRAIRVELVNAILSEGITAPSRRLPKQRERILR